MDLKYFANLAKRGGERTKSIRSSGVHAFWCYHPMRPFLCFGNCGKLLNASCTGQGAPCMFLLTRALHVELCCFPWDRWVRSRPSLVSFSSPLKECSVSGDFVPRREKTGSALNSGHPACESPLDCGSIS